MTADVLDLRDRWTSPAWRADAEAWIANALAAYDERVREVRIHRLRIYSVVLRIETDRGVRWLKETHPAAVSEVAALRLAHGVAAGLVLEPLALDDRLGRILVADATPIHELGVAPLGTRMLLAETAARLQRRLEGSGVALVVGGVPDLRPQRLEQRLLEQVELAASIEPSHAMHLDAEARAAILARVPAVREGAALLAASDALPTLEHNDLHLGNAFLVGGAMRIGDLGDAVVAHPFGSLRVLLGSARTAGLDRADVDRIRDAYLDAWSDVADAATLREAARVAIGLSGIHRWEAWWRLVHRAPRDALVEHRPYVQTLLRGLGDAEAALDEP